MHTIQSMQCRQFVIKILFALLLADLALAWGESPQAEIRFETKRGLSGPLAAASAACGEMVTLRGQAYDKEDGQLGASALTWMIDTPNMVYPSLIGLGLSYELKDFAPGNYVIRLMAADSNANTTTNTAFLSIAPKYIATATNGMVLDGSTDDAGYQLDTAPGSLRYFGETAAQVRMVRYGSNLFVSVTGMPVGINAQQFVAVCVDPNGSGDARPQGSDYRFQVYTNGEIKTFTGDGTSFAEESIPSGLQARVTVGLETWSAELAINLTRLGGWNGQQSRLSVGHYHLNYSGNDFLWPAYGVWDVPNTWAACVLGENPNDPTDSDGDGMPDKWEMDQFGDLKRDGTEDYDGDGARDVDEWVAGTLPSDPQSRLAVQIEPVAGSGFLVRWPSVLGRSYTIQRSTDLKTFSPMAVLPSDGLETSWLDAEKLSSPAFYRIDVQYWR